MTSSSRVHPPKLQWIFYWNSYISIQENATEHVICKMVSNFSWPQCGKNLGCRAITLRDISVDQHLKYSKTHWLRRDAWITVEVYFSYWLLELKSKAVPVKLVLDDFNRTPFIISQYCIRQKPLLEPMLTHVTYSITSMITSSNGNIFPVTGPLHGEFTGHQWIPRTKASDMELWWFLWFVPEQIVVQTIETPVIWDAITLIMTSL